MLVAWVRDASNCRPAAASSASAAVAGYCFKREGKGCLCFFMHVVGIVRPSACECHLRVAIEKDSLDGRDGRCGETREAEGESEPVENIESKKV